MKKGFVYLIGAGPGDPQLITLKGKQILENCDAVVYDHLASTAFLSWVPSHCRILYVGKQSGHHSMKQEQINELLINLAKEGLKVVRLKGGDSFVFGRGSEEILALREQGIGWEIVPGITSCVAVPELAGIPVTHRNVSRSFHVITGHTLKGAQSEKELASYGACEGTLVFLMGLHNLKAIAEGLLKGGKPADTPAAVIEDGSLDSQRVVRGTLKTIYEQAAKASIKTPAIIVVGETAAFDLLSDKTSDKAETAVAKPLTGLSIGITGTASFTGRLEHALREKGAKAFPVMEMKVIPEKLEENSLTKRLQQKPAFTWLVFTSVNGVELFFDTFLTKEEGDLRLLGSLRFAVIGEATKEALRKHGFKADLMPETYCSADLAETLVKQLEASDRVLILRSRDGSKDLNRALEKAGIFYEDVALYHVEGKSLSDRTTLSQCSHLIFGSASGVKAFFKEYTVPENTAVLAIGPVTGRALKEAGITPDMEAGSYNIWGIVKRLTEETVKRDSLYKPGSRQPEGK